MNINASIIDQRLAGVQDEIRDQARDELKITDAGRLKSLAFVYLCVKTMLDLDAEETFDCLTEGGGDFGVDAIHLTEEIDGEFAVTIIQGKGVDGAREKLAAAESLKKKLELILEGEAPYDIFIRWKPLDQQPIGWNPDLNDGVRLNIRPFLAVPDVAKKGAGILRDKPNIKWEKDRGKDVESAPWYHLFGGDRINDHHLSIKEKLASREGKGGS